MNIIKEKWNEFKTKEKVAMGVMCGFVFGYLCHAAKTNKGTNVVYVVVPSKEV